MSDLHETVSAPCALYGYLDANGRYLYIGITEQPSCRFAAHDARSPFAPYWAHRDLVWYPDEKAARYAEAERIHLSEPVFNIAYVRDWARRRREYLRSAEAYHGPRTETHRCPCCNGLRAATR